MAELADAGGLNPPPRKGVRDRSPPRAHRKKFPAGNPVDRSIPHAPFVAPVPADPNLISSTWTGERLQLDYVHLAIQSIERYKTDQRATAA